MPIHPDIVTVLQRLNDPERDALERLIARAEEEGFELGAAMAVANVEAHMQEEPAHSKPRRQRKPSVGTLIKRAEKEGKSVTSITMPDGTVLHLGEPQPTESSNPWLADLDKVTKK